MFDSAFLDILGRNASFRAIASNPTFAFAHEAPVWLPDTDEVTFASNDGGALGNSDINRSNIVSKISLKEAEVAIAMANASAPASVNITVTTVSPGVC